MKRAFFLLMTSFTLLTGCDDSGTVAKQAYGIYEVGGFIGEDSKVNNQFSKKHPLLDETTFINYYRCLAQRNQDIWDDTALSLSHAHGKDLILDQSEKDLWLRTIGYCCQGKTMPEEPSLDDLHALFDWSSLNILDKVEGKGLALDFPQLLHKTMAEALKLRSFNYQDPNDYLLELNVPSKYFESKLNLEKEEHQALWQKLSEQDQWKYDDLAQLLEDQEEHDALSWISTGIVKSLCHEKAILNQTNVKGELEKPLRFFTERYACRTVSEATLNAMMIALRQGLCVVEQDEQLPLSDS